MTLSQPDSRVHLPEKSYQSLLERAATTPDNLASFLCGLPSPLESLLTFGYSYAAMTHQHMERVAFVDMLFKEHIQHLRTACLEVSSLPRITILLYCTRLRQYARRTVTDHLTEKHSNALPLLIQRRVVAKLTLKELFQDNATVMARWQQALEQASLVLQARLGDKEAFTALFQTYQREVRGYIRARAWCDPDTEDIVQETWAEVWHKMPTFDSAYGTFPAFVKYRAGLMLRRYYGQQKKHRHVALAEAFTLQAPQHDLADIMQLPLLYERVLKTAFRIASPPHQLVVFAYAKLLEVPPGSIVQDLFDLPLRQLAKQFAVAYIKAVSLPTERCSSLLSHLAPLSAMMEHPLHEICCNDKTRHLYPELLEKIVGETTLRHYYEAARKAAVAQGKQLPTPQAKIVHWWHAVQRRIINIAGM